MRDLIGQTLGRYRIVAKIGEGGITHGGGGATFTFVDL